MDRRTLLNHIRTTHFESGDRQLALADAQRISAWLVKQGASRVFGIGSVFEPAGRSPIALISISSSRESNRANFFRCLPVLRQ